MSDQILDNNEGAPAVRQTFLTVLCVLTFIGSGLATFVFLFATIAFSAMSDILSRVPGTAHLLSGGIAFFAVMLVLAATSLFGAIQMWNLKKVGFYMYVGANCTAFILPLVWLKAPFDAFGLFILAVWIVLYGANLKFLK